LRFGTGFDVRRKVSPEQRFCVFKGFWGEEVAMKNLLLTMTGGLCLAFTASATTVEYQLSATATPNEYTFLFTTDAVLQQNQALVIRFPYADSPAARFTNLENPIGTTGVVYIHQPNATPLAAGDITMIAAANGTAVANFSLEGTYLDGPVPNTLPFQIIQFLGTAENSPVDVSVGGGTGILESGDATLVSGVPEPSSAMLTLAGLAMVGSYLAARRC
jgi:hypothetical protein